MDCQSKLVLHWLMNNQSVQVVIHQPRQTSDHAREVPVTRRAAAF